MRTDRCAGFTAGGRLRSEAGKLAASASCVLSDPGIAEGKKCHPRCHGALRAAQPR